MVTTKRGKLATKIHPFKNNCSHIQGFELFLLQVWAAQLISASVILMICLLTVVNNLHLLVGLLTAV